ncbi:MAG TPA: hypothetical protein VGA80_14905, partial [Flavobacteriaceae bacterium]
MKSSALKINESNESQSIKKIIYQSHTPELIIGFCGPIGTDIHFVADRFISVMENDYNYRVIKITLSELIKQ